MYLEYCRVTPMVYCSPVTRRTMEFKYEHKANCYMYTVGTCSWQKQILNKAAPLQSVHGLGTVIATAPLALLLEVEYLECCKVTYSVLAAYCTLMYTVISRRYFTLYLLFGNNKHRNDLIV